MNEHTFRVLEYDKVRTIVAAYAASEPGSTAVMTARPARDADAVQSLLSETREFLELLRSGESPPLDGIFDISQIVGKLGVSGITLSPLELLKTAQTLSAGRRVKKYFERFQGKGPGTAPAVPLLAVRAAQIQPRKEIEDAVFQALDETAEVKDSASPDLRKIRKQIVRLRDDILRRMTGILQDTGYQKVVQEAVITLRDDRYVLPLKPNFRQSLQGVVHGQSGSRATLFVEPLEVLEQNNRLAELRMEERDEVERILRELTALFARHIDPIEATADALAAIDAIYARARFGIEYNASVPVLAADRNIRLKNARHPLLVAKYKAQAGSVPVMPNDIVLEGGQRALILSGPNAGGKTVILKTVGLLCLMVQTGLPITVDEGSEVPCFRSIFADVGDEQSLEQDLSTFSSHARQIAQILNEAGVDSLVLLDELGSGTEPGEGAGLGAAVLETLIGWGCTTIVTTHHNALKLFGSETIGAANAAMEFDAGTLKPTYRLIPGRPGRSYGLDMASRLGVPRDVIDRARARIGKDDVRLEKLLEKVEEDSRHLTAERQHFEKELAAARQARQEAESALLAARKEARDISLKAKSESREILSELRQKLRELSRATALDRAALKQTSAETETLSSRLDAAAQIEQPPLVISRDIHEGDTVRIGRLNKTGRVLVAQHGMLELEVGGKKIKISAADAVPVKAQPQQPQPVSVSGWSAQLEEEEESVSDRLNLIGLRVPEALAELDRFIDHAGLHHFNTVTVIHGLGTGALKTAVTDFLRHHPLIATMRPGEPPEGGAGVTVVELKK